MSFTLKLENDDISFDNNGRLKTTTDIAQPIKIILETQYASDFRDPTYGFKFLELLQTENVDKQQLAELYTAEALTQSERVEKVVEVTSEYDSEIERRLNISVSVQLKGEEGVIVLEEEVLI